MQKTPEFPVLARLLPLYTRVQSGQLAAINSYKGIKA
jgi:hypothetical protein